jgi:hypothetical protein
MDPEDLREVISAYQQWVADTGEIASENDYTVFLFDLAATCRADSLTFQA